MRNPPLRPIGDMPMIPTAGCGTVQRAQLPLPAAQTPRYAVPDAGEVRFGIPQRATRYHQPAGALASVGVMGAGTGATQSKYVARRETPVYIAENCTQCMECITACPDTALPNTSQDVTTVLKTAAIYYVTDASERQKLMARTQGHRRTRCAPTMVADGGSQSRRRPFKDIIREEVAALTGVSRGGQEPVHRHHRHTAAGLQQRARPFSARSKRKRPAAADCSPFSFRDLCKGCGECVQVCGDHDALRMTRETEELNAELTTAQIFSRLLPDTPQKYPRPLQRRRRRRIRAKRRCAIT